MYEVIQAYPKDIILTYAIVLFSCVCVYPISLLIVDLVKRGVTRWK